MNNYLKEIGIFDDGEMRNGAYVITLEDSNIYQDLFEYLQDVDGLTIDEDNVVFNSDSNIINFISDKGYVLTLSANFKDEIYELIVKEV